MAVNKKRAINMGIKISHKMFTEEAGVFMASEHAKIEENSGRKPVSCSCNRCANMCKTCPCLGTPSDIKRLIDHGHINKITPIIWDVGRRFGLLPQLEMFAPDRDQHGHCVFLRNDLCMLHDRGLKPIEGRLATHVATELPTITVEVAKTWLDKKNWPIIQFIEKSFIRYKNAQEPRKHNGPSDTGR